MIGGADNPGIFKIARAIATNLLAHFAPSLYVRATRQTGRGTRESETAGDIADYFRRCVDDYFSILGVETRDRETYLQGKVILEYGPGDLPGVALLLCALGAEKVYCVDRFSLLSTTRKNEEVVARLIAGLPDSARRRMLACFCDASSPSSGFSPRNIEYLVRPSGLSALREKADLVISRAVLEHVDDLESIFLDMFNAMRRGAIAAHQVDLRSHGLHRRNPLDFLSLTPALWSAMYSCKGVPNRWRVDRYRAILEALPIDLMKLEPTALAEYRHVARVRHQLAEPFRDVTDQDLSWLGFWLVFRR